MRKIEKEVIGAFVDGKTKRMGNTASILNPIGTLNLMLHGNRIAAMSNRDGVKKLWVSNAGWSSRTTQSRLNALSRPSVRYARSCVCTRGKDMRRGVQYLDSSCRNPTQNTKQNGGNGTAPSTCRHYATLADIEQRGASCMRGLRSQNRGQDRLRELHLEVGGGLPKDGQSTYVGPDPQRTVQ
jgi:hypothetical protein